MKIIPSIVTLLFLIAAGTVSSPAQNATTVEPLLVYKALQDKDCRHWVDSVMDKLSFKEKVGQLFIYTIAPVDTKRNLELLREVIDTYKVGGLLFSGGKMQNQVELTNRAQRQAKATGHQLFSSHIRCPLQSNSRTYLICLSTFLQVEREKNYSRNICRRST